MFNPHEIIEKYYPKHDDIHYVLITHSEQVRNKALEIASLHPEFEMDLEFISEAAMLHDIGVFMCDAARIHCYGHSQYIEHGYLGADLLRSEGLHRHALVAERHTGVGISQEVIERRQMPIPHRDMIPLSMEEQVICYADKFFSKTQLGHIHTVERIRTSLSHHSETDVLKFDLWHKIFQ